VRTHSAEPFQILWWMSQASCCASQWYGKHIYSDHTLSTQVKKEKSGSVVNENTVNWPCAVRWASKRSSNSWATSSTSLRSKSARLFATNTPFKHMWLCVKPFASWTYGFGHWATIFWITIVPLFHLTQCNNHASNYSHNLSNLRFLSELYLPGC